MKVRNVFKRWSSAKWRNSPARPTDSTQLRPEKKETSKATAKKWGRSSTKKKKVHGLIGRRDTQTLTSYPKKKAL